MIVKCNKCNIEFNKFPYQIKASFNHFCSRSCAASFNNLGKRRNKPKLRNCIWCNSPFYRTRGLFFACINCATARRQRRLGLKTTKIKDIHNRPGLKNRHPSWNNTYIRLLNRAWNKHLYRDGCRVCGYRKHIELAHIKAIKLFNEEATLGEINDPKNVLPLCPNHHWEFDNNKLDIPI